MSKITQQQEIIIKNWETFKTQALKISKKPTTFEANLNKLAQEFMIAPASSKLEYMGAYPGGLVEHSLKVLSLMAKLRKVYSEAENISNDALLITSLFHDIGKLGDGIKFYYFDEESSWHREKLGQMYSINEKLLHIPVSQLSLWWLTNSLELKLNLDEWHAISSIRNKNIKDDTPSSSEPMLAVMLQQAVKVSCFQGKNKKEVTLISS